MNKFINYIKILILISFSLLLFVILCGDNCKNCYNTKENFTPREIYEAGQSPGSVPIGTTDREYLKQIKILTVSNGYNNEIMDNLEPSQPSPVQNKYNDIAIPIAGDYPYALKHSNNYPVTIFEYPNDYNFTVKYPCRRTATGMFTDCGVWSANTAWTADPYKGLNCKICNGKNSRSPKIKKCQECFKDLKK